MNTNLLTSFGNKAIRAAQAGFTMIELLVVIAVIGVLSVAVLSAINPIEQINKGRDTRARSDAAQLINAVDRYFSIAEEYPWNTENGTSWASGDVIATYDEEFVFEEDDAAPAAFAGTPISSWGWAEILVENSEVKQGFTTRLAQDENVHYAIYKEGTPNATMHVCFYPSSNAFQSEAEETCSGTNDWPAEACPGSCTDGSDPDSCMMCSP